MALPQGFPQISSPFVSEGRFIEQAWLQFLISLWNRTAGGTTLGPITSLVAGSGLSGGGTGPTVTLSLGTVGTYELLANPTVGDAIPVGTTLSALFDLVFGGTQGSILYRDSGVWTVLTPGTSGYVLSTNGTGANPSWISVGGTGSVTSVALTMPGIFSVAGSPITTAGTLAVTLQTESANTVWAGPTTGAAATPAFRALVTADMPSGTGTVTSIATSNGVTGGTITSTGTISLASIADQRILANISGGSTFPTANTLTAIIDACIASTQGNILYRNASSWVALAPGTSGQFLETLGAAANPTWASVALASLAAQADKTIVSNISGGSAAPSANTLTALLDNIMGSTEGQILQRGVSAWQVLAPGAANQVLISGGASALNAWSGLSALLDAVFGSVQGEILYRSSSNWVILATGASGQVLQSGGSAANLSWVTPGGGGSGIGTVTSVGLTAPANFTVSGSPVTTSGTLGLNLTSPPPPGGRLTLQTTVPVMKSSQTAKGTIYFDSYLGGNRCPVYDGTYWAMLQITGDEISCILDASGHLLENLYDMYAYNSSGLKLGTGPAWINTATITVTIATPAVVSWTAHGLREGCPVIFTTSGALPTGITAGTTYYVTNTPGANTFNISTTVANAALGTKVNTSGSQSGTHTGTNHTTVRGTGAGTTELQMVGGLWTNKNSITLRNNSSTDSVSANQATYLGTFYGTANGQTGFDLLPSAVSGGAAPILGLYNAYNQVLFVCIEYDAVTTWTYNSTTIRALNGASGNVNNKISWVDGLGNTGVELTGFTFAQANGTSFADIFYGLNSSVSAASNSVLGRAAVNATPCQMFSYCPCTGVLGFNYGIPMERVSTGTNVVTWNGFSGFSGNKAVLMI